MANIEKVDTDIAVALKFFGIQTTDISKAKDIKWLERQNVIHQLNNDKKELSNKYFAILKQQQHRIDFVANKIQQIESFETPTPKVETSKKWFDKDYRPSAHTEEMTPSLNEFKDSIEKAFMTVSMKDGELNTRTFNIENNDVQRPQTSSNSHKRDRVDSVCLAGAWMSVIGGVMLLFMSFSMWTFTYNVWGYVREEFSITGPIMTFFSIWTITSNSKIINRTAKSKVAGGVLGLIFGFFLGGLLTLCGRYDEDQ